MAYGLSMKKLSISLLMVVISFVFFTTHKVFADVLTPGSINTCGEIAFAGTYTLSTNISTSSGACLTITAGGPATSTIIDGQGLYTITGAVNGNATNQGDPGHNFTLQNVTVTSTTSADGADHTGGNASGGGSIIVINSNVATTTSNGGSSLWPWGSGYAGNGGSITITNSNITSVQSIGGSGIWAGNGGSIIITGTNLNLSNRNIAASTGSQGNGPGYSGTLTLNYTTLNYTNLTLSNLLDLTLNGPGNLPGDLGNFSSATITSGYFSGGTITDISQCSSLNLPGGIYTLGNDLTGDCHITANGITIDGAGHTLNGNIIGDAGGINSNDLVGHSFSIKNITVTGTTSANGVGNYGANGGMITVSSSTINNISAMAGYSGNGGSITLSNSTTTGTIIVNGGYGSGVNRGSITITKSSIDLTQINLTTIASSSLTLNYSTLNHTNVTLPALTDLTLNGPSNLPGDTGSFGGGNINFIPGDSITDVSQCSSLIVHGVYRLGNDLIGDCHIVSDGIALDGAGSHKIIGNVIGDATSSANSGRNFTLQNITVTGTTTSNGYNSVGMTNTTSGGSITIINSTVATTTSNGGVNTPTGTNRNNINYPNPGNRNGGSIIIINSTTTSIQANGGYIKTPSFFYPYFQSYDSGNGGTITITSTNLNLSNENISVAGGTTIPLGMGGLTGTNGTLTLNYTTLNYTNLTLSALAHLILNGPGNLPGDTGSFGGGLFSVIPGSAITNISQCASLNIAGTYNIGADLTGDCHVVGNGVVINGNGHTITGNVIGDNASGSGYNFTLENITVTGTTSSNGLARSSSGGSITISTSTANNVSAIGGFAGYPGSLTITNSNIDLSQMNLNIAGGSLTLNYSTINYANVTLPALSDLVLNGPGNLPGDLGSFAGGIIYFLPGQSITYPSQCASLTIPGTYTFNNDMTGDCHITADGITLDGTHHTINGNVIGDGVNIGDNGHNFTLENMTVTGTTSSNGGPTDYSSWEAGAGGTITISSSTINGISVNSDTDSNYGNQAGTIIISGDSIDLSNRLIMAVGAYPGSVSISGNNVNLTSSTILANGGNLTVNFETLNNSNLLLSQLADLVLNGPGNLPGDLGSFAGGIFSTILPGGSLTDASQCSSLTIPGTYTLASDLTGDCHITSSGIILNGVGHTITGNVIGDGVGSAGYDFTLENMTVTGTTSSNGATGFNGGSITISTSTANNISDVGGAGGSAGTTTITNSNIDLSQMNLNIAGGTLILNYSTLNRTNVTLPALSDLVLNGPGNIPGDVGNFAGGVISMLLPGDSITSASQCASIVATGTYILASDLTGDCHITTNGVILNGSGHTITGNVIGDGVGLGANGHNFTLENMTVTGTTSSNGVDYDSNTTHSDAGNGGTITILNSSVGMIYANGGTGDVSNLLQPGYGLSGSGGSIVVSTSTFDNIFANGGVNGFISGGVGGSITITNNVLDLSSKSIFASGGSGIVYIGQTGHAENATSGVLILNYNTLNHTNLTLSALSGLTLNGPGNVPGYVGSFVGGVLGIIPNTVIIDPSQCATLTLAGTYTLGNDLTGDCHITANGIVLDGLGQYKIIGDVIGDGINPGDSGFNFTLKNITVTGTTSSNGLDSYDYNSHRPVGTVNYRNGVLVSGPTGGNGGTITILNATTTSVITNGGTWGAITNGLGGTIIVASSTTGLLQANGGIGSAYYESAGNNGGSISVTNSITGVIQTIGGRGTAGSIALGDYIIGTKGGNGGPITVLRSITDSLLAKGGNGSTNGGNGGTISVSNSTAVSSSSAVSANGGDSTLCGYGGNGGVINLTNSSYATSTITNNAGADGPSCPNMPWGPNTPSGNSGIGGVTQISGQYSPLNGYQTPPNTTITTTVNTPVAKVTTAPSSPSASFIGSNSSPSDIPLTTNQVNNPQSVVTKSYFTPGSFASVASAAAQKVADTANAFVESPASKTVQATGFFAGLVASIGFFTESAFATPIAASEAVFIPARLWGLILMGLGIRRKSRPWGTVYDSVTKQPIDPAYITARDSTGKVVAEAVTDIDGRYGFLLPDGTYYLSVQKTNYEFPSKKLDSKQSDELYNDLYFGEPVTVKNGEVIDKNIPMDQENFDWNQQNKTQSNAQNAPSFHRPHEKPFAIASNYIYGLGLIISAVAVAMKPSAFNIMILISYTLILLFLRFSVKTKRLGSILDKNTHQPLSYAIVRITTPDKQIVLRSGVTDAQGHYYCIVPKGEYSVEIQKKNADGTYSKVYESGTLTNKIGIVNMDFTV